MRYLILALAGALAACAGPVVGTPAPPAPLPQLAAGDTVYFVKDCATFHPGHQAKVLSADGDQVTIIDALQSATVARACLSQPSPATAR